MSMADIEAGLPDMSGELPRIPTVGNSTGGLEGATDVEYYTVRWAQSSSSPLSGSKHGWPWSGWHRKHQGCCWPSIWKGEQAILIFRVANLETAATKICAPRAARRSGHSGCDLRAAHPERGRSLAGRRDF